MSAPTSVGRLLVLLSCLAAVSVPGASSGDLSASVARHVAGLAAGAAEGEGRQGAVAYLTEQIERMGALPLEAASGTSREEGAARDGATPGGPPAAIGSRDDVIAVLPAATGDPDDRRAPVVVGARLRVGDGSFTGPAALLAVGESLARKPPPGPVILAFWSDPESGPGGASRFLAQSDGSGERIVGYLDLDRVGCADDDRLDLHAVGSSPVWGRLIEQTNVVVGLDVRIHPTASVSPDAAVFYQASVPIVGLSTSATEGGAPREGQGPCTGSGVGRVVRFAALLARKLAGLEKLPQYVAAEHGRTKPTVDRAYTGTVPDYAADAEGLRLSGVIGGGPAQRAGLRAGDVIIEIDGRRIEGVYDYSEVLDDLEVGRTVPVVCVRDGKRLELSITPTARP